MANLSPHLLLVEDDNIWQEAVRLTMVNQGWNVICCSDSVTSKNILNNQKIDLCLIDLDLGKCIDGFTIVDTIKQSSPHSQVIILSGIDNDQNKIKGLELGVQDYLTKPISLKELVLRLNRWLRQSNLTVKIKECHNSICFNEFSFYKDNFVLFYQQQLIHLTTNERLLLFHFLTKPEGKLKREIISIEILKKAWSPTDRAVDMLISSLRQKLNSYSNQIVIKSIRGVGYQLIIA
ncbi:MAG TPA: response regulator transcription factor [Ferrovaceae bacterium]|uniref:response regulator transcription factor n=1 Tax=Ferrovum sp. JA12 TaxID=1356299 RepID=UPI00136495A5|nr:response regulator transcription factor [Ferrovum sp. JA12]HQT80824.1 response regulator transcription factor [Ferrovaceae bacterium]HQU06564.1 response regulator transcription factor [Ferrovaceae bacterium]